MLILGAGVLFLVYWFFFRKKILDRESSYDNNLMIFGNENGYTNYQLDGGSLESSYGPDFGAYGSYGNESGYQDTYIKSAKTPCKKGYYQVPGDKYTWCVKDAGAMANPIPMGTGLFGKI